MFSNLLVFFYATLATASHYHSQYIPNPIANGPSIATWESTVDSFDSSRLSSFNDSVFQWWWFSAISADTSTYLAIIFFTTSNNAFPLTGNPDPDGVLTIDIDVRYADGTQWGTVITAQDATIEWGGDLGDGVLGTYDTGNGTCASFYGTPDLSKFTVSIDDPASEVSGTLQLTSTAPAHYACSKKIGAGQKEATFGEHLGWANALPGSVADARFNFNGSEFIMTNGQGYHDMNWGDAPFLSLIKSWYWGRTTLGPYTIVFADGLLPDGSEEVAGYVAKDGKELLSTCKTAAVSVRPVGPQAQYPPTPGHRGFDHLHVVLDIEEGKSFVFNLTKVAVVGDGAPLYMRWIGHASGGVVGEESYKGAAEFEEFTVF